MLSVGDFNVYYGDSHVIRDVSFELGPSETVAVMGRNGMGKTTLFKALIGILPSRSGRVRLGGADLALNLRQGGTLSGTTAARAGWREGTHRS